MVQLTKSYNKKKTVKRSVSLPTSCSSTLNRPKFRRVSPTTSSGNKKKACTTSSEQVQKHRYPLTALEEYIAKLREKNVKGEEVIQAQDAEIAQLRRLSLTLSATHTSKHLDNHTKAGVSDQAAQGRTTSGVSAQQTESLNPNANADLKNMVSKYIAQIEQLQSIIRANEEKAAKQSEDYQREISEKDQSLQREQELYQQLKEDYVRAMDTIKLEHEQQLRGMEQQHEKDLAKLRKEIEELKKSKLTEKSLDDALEKVLYEIEQEEHNLPPAATTFGQRNDLKSATNNGCKDTVKKLAANQQWYSQKFIPSQAISWPAPQSLPNLKKQLHK